MSKPTTLSTAQQSEIIDLFLEGKPVREIARDLGIEYGRVRRFTNRVVKTNPGEAVIRAAKVAQHHAITNATKKRVEHPKGWEPGYNTETGTAMLRSDRSLNIDEFADEFSALLKEWGFDPSRFQIEDDKVEIRTWDAHYGIGNDPKKFWYYKAKVIRKRAQDPVNMSGLVSHIRTRKPLKDKVWTPGDRTFLVGNADWQLGKRDGRGTEYAVNAIKRSIPMVGERYEALRNQGHQIDHLFIANMGDIVEGCDGFYPMQTYGVELSRREQVRLGRELQVAQILAWADDFEKVTVLTIPGNHGEKRNDDGKVFTNLGDNDDIAVTEQVAEAFDLANDASGGRYDHVKFLIPDNELTVVLDLHGTIVGFTHGHAGGFRPKVGKDLSHTKVWDWWYGQTMGRQPVADADLLLSAHYHYLSVISQGGRTAIQFPPMEDGSEWYMESNGMGSYAAQATMLIGGGHQGTYQGWSDLHIIDHGIR